jgi:hypothetical protein
LKLGEIKVNEKQLFGVLVRAMGVLTFMDAFRIFWNGCIQWIFPRTSAPISVFFLEMVAPNLSYGLLVMILGASMIRWPGWVVHLAWLDHLPTIGREPGSESND